MKRKPVINMNKEIIAYNNIDHITKLAKIRLGKEEKELFSRQINDILSFLRKIGEPDIENIQPTFNINTPSQHFHEDIATPSLPQDVALGMTEYHKNGYFEVPGIL